MLFRSGFGRVNLGKVYYLHEVKTLWKLARKGRKLITKDHAFPPHSEVGEAFDVHLFCKQRSSVASTLRELWSFSNHFRLAGDETGILLPQIPSGLTCMCQRGG